MRFRLLFYTLFSILCFVLHGNTFALNDRASEYIFVDEQDVTMLVNWVSKWGDSSNYKDFSFNDSGWQANKGFGLWVSENGTGKGIRWYRKAIFIPKQLDTLKMLSLYQVAAVSAFELYWDGKCIAVNGVPSTDPKKEISGYSGQLFLLKPEYTTPGKHVIALRMSNHHGYSGVIDSPFLFGYFDRINKHLFGAQAVSIFLAGIFFLTAMFHLAILLGHGNKWPYALFSAYCLSSTAYIIIRGLLRYFQIDLQHYYTLAAINDIPWFLMMVLLPAFFLFEFNSPYKKRLSTYIASVALIIILVTRLVSLGIVAPSWLTVFGHLAKIHTNFSLLVALGVAVWAGYKRKIGSLSASVGLVVFIIGIFYTNQMGVENGWAIGFGVLNIFLTLSLSNQMGHRNREHHQIQLRSVRLEMDLLKKSIQPHFLLNSLNSIVAWLEEDPSTASRLVNALADELRMLLSFSGESVISLDDEIRLCRSHCEVMSLRHDKQFSFNVTGKTTENTIPPMILHTLVENGLTHGYRNKDTGIFTLLIERKPDFFKLIFENDGDKLEKKDSANEGTGMRYIRTRLEEVYTGAWTLKSGHIKNGWRVIIEIRGEDV